MHLSVRRGDVPAGPHRDLAGYHPSDPTQRFTLRTAVLGARLLRSVTRAVEMSAGQSVLRAV